MSTARPSAWQRGHREPPVLLACGDCGTARQVAAVSAREMRAGRRPNVCRSCRRPARVSITAEIRTWAEREWARFTPNDRLAVSVALAAFAGPVAGRAAVTDLAMAASAAPPTAQDGPGQVAA